MKQSYANLVLHAEAGIEPVNLLPTISISPKLVILVNISGIVPLNSFLWRKRISRFVNCASSWGRFPVIDVPDIRKESRLLRLAISLGIVPIQLGPSKTRDDS